MNWGMLDAFCAKAEGARRELRVGGSGDGVSSVVLAVEVLVCLSTRKELAGSGDGPVHAARPSFHILTNQTPPSTTIW